VAIRRLEAERGRLRRSNFRSDYVRGVLDGLRMAAGIILGLWDETRMRLIDNPKYLSTVRSHFSNRRYIRKAKTNGSR